MNISRIDLNLLLVLDAIYSEASITRASHKLHLSQPATSHALRRLRNALDDPLFVRDGQQMLPTPLARSIIEPVRRALREIETGLSRTQCFEPATSRRSFRIGVRAALESTLLPRLMAALERRAPGLQIEAIRPERRQLQSNLQNGTLDLAVDTLQPVGSGVLHRPLGEDRLVVLARPGHPMTGATLDLGAYLEAEHVLVSSRRSGPGFEDVELQRHGLERRIRLRCQHHFTACHVIATGDLLLTMPQRQARIVNRCFDHQLFVFPLETASLDAQLYWHSNVEHDPANRWLRDLVVETMASRNGT